MEPQVEDYQFDGVDVRLRTREVLCQGKPLSIEPKSFRVLVYLIQNRDRAIGKDELIEKVWDGVAVTDNSLARAIAQLRKELGDDARQPRYIQTLPTLGYRFIAEIASPAAPPPPEPPARRRSMLLPAAVVFIAIGAAAAAWLYAIRRPVIAPAQSHPVQITSSPGLDLNGSFSPDGSSLAYSSNRSGHFEIYLRPLDARGRELQITADGKENLDAAWSPDGSAIAFYSVRRHGICIVPALGGAARQITTFGSQPAWSPDGHWIAFDSSGPRTLSPTEVHTGDYQSTIWIVAPDGSGLRQVTQPQSPAPYGAGEVVLYNHAAPSWWPDGKRILFSAGGRLAVVTPGSGKSEILTPQAAHRNAVPAPDGQSIYYADGNRIFRLPLSGDRRPVLAFTAETTYPVLLSLSRAGNRLAFTQMAVRSELWQTQPSAEPRPIFQDVGVRAMNPNFSPDGQKIAFVTGRFGSGLELWTANADGSGATALDSLVGGGAWPSWSAAGSAILYFDNNATEMLRISPGGMREVLLKGGVRFGSGQVTPDERSVIYQTGRPLNLWKLTLGAGKPTQLTFDPEHAGFASISPDGKWVVYEPRRDGGSYVAVMDIDGRGQRQLTSGGSFDFARSFSSDDRHIASATFQDGAWNITTIDRLTGERKVLTHYTEFGPYVRYPAWRPNTEQIVYERTSMTGNVYALEIPAK